MIANSIFPTPWDANAFSINCFEITKVSDEALAHAATTPGHYTIKVEPLTDKALLHQYGFYYTDTLIEPVCMAGQLISHHNPDCSIATEMDLKDLLPMCDGSFQHGRFHRDFNLSNEAADQRYKQWLTQLYRENEVIGLYYQQCLAGFIAHKDGKLLLHTISNEFRGQGLAKYFWSETAEQLFSFGINEIRSSVSSTNLPVLNLYASLGFRFYNAVDIYHRLTR